MEKLSDLLKGRHAPPKRTKHQIIIHDIRTWLGMKETTGIDSFGAWMHRLKAIPWDVVYTSWSIAKTGRSPKRFFWYLIKQWRQYGKN